VVPADPVELIQRAGAALQRGAWREAAELAQSVLQRFGPEPNAVNLAAAYRASGQLPEARRTLDAALQVDRRFAIAHNNLGNVLIDLNAARWRRQALRG
jgi:tetratricopeptide (TPR) repeat protein